MWANSAGFFRGFAGGGGLSNAFATDVGWSSAVSMLGVFRRVAAGTLGWVMTDAPRVAASNRAREKP
jgi:hypothetical protein